MSEHQQSMNDAPLQPLVRAIARRPIRVAAGGLRPAIRTQGFCASPAAFARSIADRYGRRAAARLPLLHRILGRAVAVMTQPRHHHTHVAVTPRLALTVIRWGSGERPPSAAPPPPFRARVPKGRLIDALVERLVVRKRVELVRIERTTHRLLAQTTHRRLARQERIAAPERGRVWNARYPAPGTDVPPIGHEGEEARLSIRAPQRVPRVHRRPVAAPIPAQAAAPALTTSTIETRRPTALPQRTAAVELGAAEVDRLAERVIQVIDRRIVAQRERMGRR